MPRHASHKRPKPFLGELLQSCKIAVLNSLIFWHFGLRLLIFRPIKFHACSIGFMFGDIAGHGIVWTAYCCKKCCTIRALCGLALSSMSIGLSDNAWLSKWGTKSRASTLSRYFWPVRLPARTYTSNIQSKEKQPQTDTPPTPKAVMPKMWLSWSEVFRWRQTLARPSEGLNQTRLSSDQWTRLHVRIVHPKWSCDQSNRAWRWRNVNWTFYGSSRSHSLKVEASDYSACANVASKHQITTQCTSCTERPLPRPSGYEPVLSRRSFARSTCT